MDAKLSVEISAQIADLKAKLDQASKHIADFGKRQDDYFSKRESQGRKEVSLNNQIFSSLKGIVAAYISLQAAVQLVGKAFDTALKIDQIKSALTFILGSSEAAEKQFDKLAQMADHLGLELTSLADSYKLFAGSAMTAGMTQNDTNRIFEAFAQAASVMKLSADDTRGALNAVAQMISKGNVQAEELRGQLGERLPGAFNMAAKAMGVTTKELNKMLEQGQVLAVDLLPKLAEEMERTFGQATVDKAEGLQAAVNRLSNTFTKAVESGNTSTFFQDIVIGANKSLEALIKLTNSKAWNAIMNSPAFDPANINADQKSAFEKRALIDLPDFNLQRTGNGGLEFLNIILAQTGKIRKETEDIKKTWDNLGGDIEKAREKMAPLEKVTGASDMIDEANALLQLYKEYPGALNVLAEAYLRNPLFRDLIADNQKSVEKVDKLKKSITELNDGTVALANDPAMDRYIANWQTAVNLISSSMTNAFEQAMLGGEDFFKVFAEGLKKMIAQLVAAVATAIVLAAVLNAVAPGAGAAVGGFGGILKTLTGFNTGGFAGANGMRVAGTGMIAPAQISVTGVLTGQGDQLLAVITNATRINQRIQ